MKRMKRVMAWIGIIILAGLYLTTFILGITANEATKGFFMASVVCTVLIPVLFYAMLLVGKTLSSGGISAADGSGGADGADKTDPSSKGREK